jgi:hypothetical protein
MELVVAGVGNHQALVKWLLKHGAPQDQVQKAVAVQKA